MRAGIRSSIVWVFHPAFDAGATGICLLPVLILAPVLLMTSPSGVEIWSGKAENPPPGRRQYFFMFGWAVPRLATPPAGTVSSELITVPA